jgi:hypothetical protein
VYALVFLDFPNCLTLSVVRLPVSSFYYWVAATIIGGLHYIGNARQDLNRNCRNMLQSTQKVWVTQRRPVLAYTRRKTVPSDRGVRDPNSPSYSLLFDKEDIVRECEAEEEQRKQREHEVRMQEYDGMEKRKHEI